MSTIIYNHCNSFPHHFSSNTPFTTLNTKMHRSDQMSVAGPSRVSPTLYPTPPPTAISQHLPGTFQPLKQNAIPQFPAAQPILPNSQRDKEDDAPKQELPVCSTTAQSGVHVQLRVTPCPWRQDYQHCDALLGSVELLQRVCLSH
jgi:hypothetical protein